MEEKIHIIQDIVNGTTIRVTDEWNSWMFPLMGIHHVNRLTVKLRTKTKN